MLRSQVAHLLALQVFSNGYVAEPVVKIHMERPYLKNDAEGIGQRLARGNREEALPLGGAHRGGRTGPGKPICPAAGGASTRPSRPAGVLCFCFRSTP